MFPWGFSALRPPFVVGGVWIITSRTGSPPRHRNAVLVGRMRAAFSEAAGAGLSSMPLDEVGGCLADLERLVAQAKAELLSAVREADRREVAKGDRHDIDSGVAVHHAADPPRRSRSGGEAGRDLHTELAATRAALQAGEISAEHAEVIARSLRRLPPWVGLDKRAGAETLLVEEAGTFDPKDLAGWGRTVLHTIDADLADRELARQLEADEARAEREREITLFDDPYSISTFLHGKLDPVTNEMFRVALDPLSKPRPTDADGPDLRSHAQRMGDGFRELL